MKWGENTDATCDATVEKGSFVALIGVLRGLDQNKKSSFFNRAHVTVLVFFINGKTLGGCVKHARSRLSSPEE
jgi:hypothetical protein